MANPHITRMGSDDRYAAVPELEGIHADIGRLFHRRTDVVESSDRPVVRWGDVVLLLVVVVFGCDLRPVVDANSQRTDASRGGCAVYSACHD